MRWRRVFQVSKQRFWLRLRDFAQAHIEKEPQEEAVQTVKLIEPVETFSSYGLIGPPSQRSNIDRYRGFEPEKPYAHD